MAVGSRIKAARKAAGMTQAELAEKLDLPFQSVSQWERGYRNPKYDTLNRISNALGCPVELLIDDPASIEAEDAIDALLFGGQIARVSEYMSYLTVGARNKVEEYVKDLMKIPEYHFDLDAEKAPTPGSTQGGEDENQIDTIEEV